jgi:hypothetical protein
MGLRGASHVAAMLRRCGVLVRLGEDRETYAIEDTTDEDLLSAEAASFAGTVRALLIQTDTLEGLEPGARLEYGGEFLRVIQTRRLEDGETQRVLCRPEA